jgi:hypothetical protein
MTYIAAISVAGKFKLADLQVGTPEAAMLAVFNSHSATEEVILAPKVERASSAPKQEDLYRLIQARLAPAKVDGGWFSGSNELIRKMFLNLLENPNAKLICWHSEEYKRWLAQAEAKAQAEAETKAREETTRQSPHGYVYAFHFRDPNGTEFIKIGMTTSDDEGACWRRIRGYIKWHSLPNEGWTFVAFIASTKAKVLELKLHHRLRMYRANGKARELFRCSLSVYQAIVDAEYDFILSTEPPASNGETVCDEPEPVRTKPADQAVATRAEASRDKTAQIISLLATEKERKAFAYFLQKGPGQYNAHQVGKEIGDPRITGLLNLRSFFNKHREFRYKIKGSGPYDPYGNHPDNWIKFIVL